MPYSFAVSEPEPRLTMSRRRRTRLVTLAVVAAAVAGLAAWYVNNPRDLPVTAATVNATTAAGRPVYVGMFTPPGDFDRTLELSGVKVRTTANTQVEVVPLLCRGGSLAVTTDPTAFCAELVNPEGEPFGPGDSIVLEVSATETAIAAIDRVRLGFREGLQWGTREAGGTAVVSIQGR